MISLVFSSRNHETLNFESDLPNPPCVSTESPVDTGLVSEDRAGQVDENRP